MALPKVFARITGHTNLALPLGGTFDNGNSGAAATVDWTKGNKQKITLTANCTFTFTAPDSPSGAVGTNLLLRLTQDGTGSRTATWPASIKWVSATAPTLSTGAGAVDIVSLYWDGTNYYASYGLNFA